MSERIQDYFQITPLALEPDVAALEMGGGYVLPEKGPQAVIHTQAEANYIALFRFRNGVPRGNHYHLEKVEYLVCLRGTVQCDLRLVADGGAIAQVTVSAGDCLRVMPQCIHTYTAVGDDAICLEYSPTRFAKEDLVQVKPPAA